MNLQMTTKAQEAFSAATRSAAAAGNPHVEPAHLLLALTDQRVTARRLRGEALTEDEALDRAGYHGS